MQEESSISKQHRVLSASLYPPFPETMQTALFGMGCFWGAEKLFWSVKGIYTTMVGYAGGWHPHPDYQHVCSGRTGHCEAVRLVYDPALVSYQTLLALFWTSHNPCQGMRQGNDVGSQYRSAIYWHTAEQADAARYSRQRYQQALISAGLTASITTEILKAPTFYYAEDYHQQYLAANPHGYCGLMGTGVAYPETGQENSD